MSRKHPSQPVLRTQSDILRMWRRRAPSPGRQGVCVVLIRPDGRPSQRCHLLDRFGVQESPLAADRMMACLEEISEDLLPIVRWAILYCRPGPEPLNDHDRAVCRWIRESAERRGVQLTAIHVRTGAGLVPVAPDDLIAA